MVSSEAISWAKAHFSRHNLNASDDWIRACVEWCQRENTSLMSDRMRLVESVRLQWLDTDLRDEGVQSGPQLAPGEIRRDALRGSTARGPFAVQVLYAVDVSKPAYGQLQGLLKVDDRNVEVTAERTQARSWTPAPAPRMLKLALTDGYSTVEAIESQPCTDLVYPVPCGLKLLLTGPLEVRRGVVLLKPANAKVLGGVVEELEARKGLKHQLERILSRESPTASSCLPTQTYAPPANAGKLIKYRGQAAAVSAAGRSSFKREDPFGDDDDDDDDDQIFSQIPDDALKMEDADDDIFSAIEIPEERRKQKVSTAKQELPSVPTTTSQESCGKKARTSQGGSPRPEALLGKPFQYLSHFTSHRVEVGASTTVKGCFVTLAGKLSIKDGGRGVGKYWHLQAYVTDGSETLKVTLATGLLQGWLGAVPSRYVRMTPDEKAAVKTRMRGVSEKLMLLNALLKIVKKIPTCESEITDVVALNRGHAQQLKVRSQRMCTSPS